MPNQTYKNILVIKMSSLGDVIHALPCAAALRHLYPEARISWIIEPAFEAFLPGEPYLDEVLVFRKDRLRTGSLRSRINYLVELKTMLAAKKYDLVIDLQGLLKSALIAWLTGAPNKIGYCEMREMSSLVSKPICGPNQHGHVVERYLDVIRYLGTDIGKVIFPLPDLSQEEAEVETILSTYGCVQTDRLIALSPGTRWQSKCWPVEYYSAVARSLLQDGYQVVIIGGPGEKHLSEAIVRENPDVLDLTGRTTSRQLAALLRKARLYIVGDTGPMHIAAAVGTQMIGLFGPSDPKRTGAYGNNHIMLTAGTECAPCFKTKCSHLSCMYGITPEQVIQAAAVLLARSSAKEAKALEGKL